MADAWTQTEVEAIVRDYFDMLSKELQGIPFKKSEHRNGLLDTIPRSAGSIEYKHQNISAVLLELGMPFITGYKPAKNYQRKVLPDAVLDYVIAHPEIQQQMSEDVVADVAIPTVDDILGALVQPPEPRTSPEPTLRARGNRKSVPVDYLAREASNRSLGAAGEQFVMNYEKARLLFAGQDTLSDRIEQVAVTEGDAAGYDIRSYNDDGTDRFIEAKTTKYGIDTPFWLTANELSFSDSNRDAYQLYRVFEFRREPRMFVVPGYIGDRARLVPKVYTAYM